MSVARTVPSWSSVHRPRTSMRPRVELTRRSLRDELAGHPRFGCPASSSRRLRRVNSTRGRIDVRGLCTLDQDGTVRATDIAAEAGLALETRTFGAIVFDY